MRKRSLRSLRRYLPFFILLNSVHHNPALPLQSFPELAADFAPPDWVHGDTFSSVLRVSSSDVALWMHYDVFDNLLYQVVPLNALPNLHVCSGVRFCWTSPLWLQIAGRKRITMFAPSDRLKLYCDGDKSMVGDPAAADVLQFPLLQQCEPFVCELVEGEVLYIPAMWFHHVKMLSYRWSSLTVTAFYHFVLNPFFSCHISIAVNTFFYHLPRSMFYCKDVYGNADPLPAQKASKHLDLVLSSLQQLPPDTADFYVRGCIERLSRALLLRPISGAEFEEFGFRNCER